MFVYCLGISGDINDLNKRITDGLVINQYDDKVVARSVRVDDADVRSRLRWSEGAKRTHKQKISDRDFCKVKNYFNEIFFKC